VDDLQRCASERITVGMATTSRALTVRLDEQDYERLEREATRLGIRPGTLTPPIWRWRRS
jgi:hypothetical protein